MTHTNRNFVLAYVFLVGLPLLVLVGILKSGRGLSAPFSVDGTWKVESSLPYASSCSDFFSSFSTFPLSISQSGKSLVVTLNGGAKAAPGMLEGNIITARFGASDKSGGAQCGEGSFILTAKLDSAAEPRTLSGTLAVEGCKSCALEFHAARLPRPPGGTR